MITFGVVKSVENNEDGTLWMKIRIPSIHGADDMKQYNGTTIRNYVADDDLPLYQSMLMTDAPNVSDIVALETLNTSKTDFIVIGVMRRAEK